MIEMIVSAIVGVGVAGILHVIGLETSRRARHVLDLPIRIAVRRLPQDIREEYAGEWRAEMAAILAENRGLPATRAWRASRFCVSLLRAGGGVADAESAVSTAFSSPLPRLESARLLYTSEFGLGDVPALRAATLLCTWLTDWRMRDLNLVISELTANSIRHGGGHGSMSLWQDGDDVVCEVRDLGVMKDPLIGRRRPDAQTLGGWGLWIVNQMCDLVEIRSSAESGTVVRVRMSQGG